jgi:hypothetical protein
MTAIPDDVFEAALCGLSMFITDRRRYTIHDVPPEVRAAHQFMSTMSARGHGFDGDDADSDLDDWIGAAESASLLGCTPRHVRRIGDRLGEIRHVGKVYQFRRRSVIEYAEARERNRIHGRGQRHLPPDA